jgi:hypothetical protein
MKYYLEVISSEVSFLVDSDVEQKSPGYYKNLKSGNIPGYYKNLKSGSILEVEFSENIIKLIRIDKIQFPIVNPVFYLNIEKVDSKRLTISSLISLRKMVDVTDSINRQKKLEQLGI